MSTKATVWYHPPVHIYVELMSDWVRLSVGSWLDIGLYKRLRAIYRPRWLGRFACWSNHHDWWLDQPTFNLKGPSIYTCQRCRVKTER